MSDKTFYVTTPIYYVNARPHIGHAYTTIVADVLARRHRLLGDDTFFLTGTDEHGQKIERSAAAAGIPPQQFADQVSASPSRICGSAWASPTTTTSAPPASKHKRGVQKLFSTLYESGSSISTATRAAYCVSDEAFVDAPAGTPCPDCGRLLEEVTEENFFFKLSEFQAAPDRADRVRQTLDHAGVAAERSPELRARRAEGPLHLAHQLHVGHSGSRGSSLAAQKHVIYVWLDALANYMTALGYGSDDASDCVEFKFWPADLHLVGKEIIRFHCVYWPAFLLAAELAAAEGCHGAWLAAVRRVEDVEVQGEYRPDRNDSRCVWRRGLRQAVPGEHEG